MSTAGAGGGEDPSQTPGSSAPKKTRGPTTGIVSARASVGVPDANLILYHPVRQTFYQTCREANILIGAFNHRNGSLVRELFPLYIDSWKEADPQNVATLLARVHNEYVFKYEHPETGELLPTDRHRSEIDHAIIHEAKRLRRGHKSKVSRRFFKTCCGSSNIA